MMKERPAITILRGIQSVPTVTLISHMRGIEGTVTAITHRFDPAKPVFCWRCPEGTCSLTDHVCMFQVNRYVSEDDAPDYSTRNAAALPADRFRRRDLG